MNQYLHLPRPLRYTQNKIIVWYPIVNGWTELKIVLAEHFSSSSLVPSRYQMEGALLIGCRCTSVVISSNYSRSSIFYDFLQNSDRPCSWKPGYFNHQQQLNSTCKIWKREKSIERFMWKISFSVISCMIGLIRVPKLSILCFMRVDSDDYILWGFSLMLIPPDSTFFRYRRTFLEILVSFSTMSEWLKDVKTLNRSWKRTVIFIKYEKLVSKKSSDDYLQ